MTYTDPYPALKGSQRVTKTCGKCGGDGWIPTIVDGGICWPCRGAGTVTVLVSSARATARRQAVAAAEQAEQAATAGDHYDTAKAALTARIPYFEVAHSGQLGHAHAHAASQAVIDYRDRERAVDHYDYATRRRLLPRLLGPNRYPDRCAACQQRVGAGAGVCGDLPDRYLTWCAAHVPTEIRDR